MRGKRESKARRCDKVGSLYEQSSLREWACKGLLTQILTFYRIEVRNDRLKSTSLRLATSTTTFVDLEENSKFEDHFLKKTIVNIA